MARKKSEITPEIVAEHGLSESEYEIILDRLGREPNLNELGIFSVMWSEHCSYKSSRRHLAKFLTKGDRVIQGPGENAGVIDIDDGDAIIFKMESHNPLENKTTRLWRCSGHWRLRELRRRSDCRR